MMTASSVEFFPCRVQLMGLPRSASTSSANTVATNLVNRNDSANLQTAAPSRPQLATLRQVSRNLFGAPDPEEINHLYQQEAERRRSYILQRYDFDIKNQTKPTTKQNARQPTDSLNTTTTNTTSTTTNKQPNTQLPTLIEQELKQHEQRLQAEQLNLNRSSETILSKKNKIILNDSCSAGGSKIMRGCSGEESLTLCATERQKPYSRQSLLTDNFNLRKNNISWTSNCKKTNAKMITLKSGLHSHHKLEVLQMPQALQAHEETSKLKEEEDHTNKTTANNEKCVVDDDCSSHSNSDISSNSCPAALSLKVVVSTQDSSSLTTSDASNAHTQNHA